MIQTVYHLSHEWSYIRYSIQYIITIHPLSRQRSAPAFHLHLQMEEGLKSNATVKPALTARLHCGNVYIRGQVIPQEVSLQTSIRWTIGLGRILGEPWKKIHIHRNITEI